MNAYPYDLHIHSCLSPCGDDDMTPNNLAGMAALSGCQVIAITDHNTCKNAGAVMEAGREAGLMVVPGMELCTAEEAHVVCLFETLEGAMAFDQYVWENMPHIPNRPEIFGEQRLMDSQDRQIGLLEDLLLVSSFLGVDQVPEIAARYGGVAFPAHVNRDSYSVLASLGTIPPETGFTTAEVTRDCDLEALEKTCPQLKDLKILRSSDSHYLETLATGEPLSIHLPELSCRAVVEAIRQGKGRG